MGYTPAARINLASDWRGTAEELAAKASEFLAESGFDQKFFCTERLVRYYLTRGVISPPEKDVLDRRKALFAPLQFRQLVLTRLLAERGWDLERVAGQLQGPKGPKTERELDELLNQLAEPTEAERLLFRSRLEQPSLADFRSRPGLYHQSNKSVVTVKSDVDETGEEPSRAERRPARESLTRKIIHSARSEEGGLAKLSMIAEKMLRDPDLQPGEAAALRELADMARLAFRQGSRKERWTRVRLAPWCEVNIKIGKDGELSESQKSHIIKEFIKVLEDYDTRLGL